MPAVKACTLTILLVEYTGELIVNCWECIGITYSTTRLSRA